MSESHTVKSMNVPKLELKPVELDIYKSNPVEFRKDIGSLFNVSKNVLNYSTSLADRWLLGKRTDSKPPTLDNKSNFARSILKQICCKVSCEKEGDVIGSIEKITPTYSWAERAVLTLATFAWSYGELSCLIDIGEVKEFALFSWLKRVDLLTAFRQDGQFKRAIIDLNRLTSSTLSMVELSLQLEELSNDLYIEDQSSETIMKSHIEYYSKLAISAAVACLAQVNYFTFERVSIEGAISKWFTILDENLQNLPKEIKLEIEKWAYWKLDMSFRIRKGTPHVFTCFTRPQVPQLASRGAEKPVLEGQNVLLFISEVTVPQHDLSAMQMIYWELNKRNPNYKIVWIPVVNEWTTELILEFSKAKQEMPWYILCYETTSEPIVGIKYIKKEWQYSYRSMVVVLNSQGSIECPDAMPMIRIWGYQAFPFTLKPRPVYAPIPSIIHFLDEKINEETYFFSYGGTKEWGKEFETKLIQMINDVYFKATKIVAVSFSGEKDKGTGVIFPKKEEIYTGQFWNCIDSVLYVMMQYNQLNHAVTVGIQKLLSLKNEVGWVALCKGSNVLVCGSGNLIYEAVALFISNWKIDSRKPGATLEGCLWNYLKPTQPPCRHISLQNCSGWLPAEVPCPDCKCRMERVVTYKCCHPTLANINGA